jgi:hypothetical protein
MSVEGITETSQYLTFKLDREIYALDITQVWEVFDFTDVTKVPRMPGFMRGVINLRGGVVPVVEYLQRRRPIHRNKLSLRGFPRRQFYKTDNLQTCCLTFSKANYKSSSVKYSG